MLKIPRRLRNNKGLATIEMIPVMIVIAILMNFALGFFGIIQTGILNQIAARNYAFETFRHRTNLLYFHDLRGSGDSKKYNARVHGIASESRGAAAKNAQATTRPIGFGMNPDTEGSAEDHDAGNGGGNKGIFSIGEGVRNQDVKTAPVWIRPMYGICLNAKCSQ